MNLSIQPRPLVISPDSRQRQPLTTKAVYHVAARLALAVLP